MIPGDEFSSPRITHGSEYASCPSQVGKYWTSSLEYDLNYLGNLIFSYSFLVGGKRRIKQQ